MADASPNEPQIYAAPLEKRFSVGPSAQQRLIETKITEQQGILNKVSCHVKDGDVIFI